MKNYLYLIGFLLILFSCKDEGNKSPEPMSNFITAEVSLNTGVLTNTTQGEISIHNLSSSGFNHQAYVSVRLYDTVNNQGYESNILMNSDNYSTPENSEELNDISIPKKMSINKTLEFNKLYWNDGLSLMDLPASVYRVGVSVFVLAPDNPGNIIQSNNEFLTKEE